MCVCVGALCECKGVRVCVFGFELRKRELSSKTVGRVLVGNSYGAF